MGSRSSCHKTHPSSAFLIFKVCCTLWLCNCTFFLQGMVSCFPWLRSPSACWDRRETDVMLVKLIPSCPSFHFLSLHGRGQPLRSRLGTFSFVCPYLPTAQWRMATADPFKYWSMFDGSEVNALVTAYRNLIGLGWLLMTGNWLLLLRGQNP